MSMNERKFSLLDRFIVSVDNGVRTLFNKPQADMQNPAVQVLEGNMSAAECRHSAGLMRVNYTGEVCAQALYQGAALVARTETVRKAMVKAAQEEVNHLAWCKERLNELHSHTSYLNPIWYLGSFGLGVLAGVVGDKWSLGFVEETEEQVGQHLQSHLTRLPPQDHKSHKIVAQMHADELSHADMARKHGAVDLPFPVKVLMRYSAKLMTTTAYYI